MVSGNGVHRLAGVCSLRESPPGAARQRVTFLAGTRKVTKRSAFKCERTFDRASEPEPPTPPLEVRLEMRSVCAVALCTTAAPRYGSASRTPQQSDEHASRRRRASAAGRLVSATTAALVPRSLGGTQGTAHADRICSTAPGIKRQAALSLHGREAFVGLLGGTAGAPVPRSFGGTERYSAH